MQLPLPFEAARFEEGGKVDEAAVMEWAKKNGGADGWGPKGPTMADIMRSWDQRRSCYRAGTCLLFRHLPRSQDKPAIWSSMLPWVVGILRRVPLNGWT